MAPGVCARIAGDIREASSALRLTCVEGLGEGAEAEAPRAASSAGCRIVPLTGGTPADVSVDCAVCGAGESTEFVRPPT